VKRAQSSSGPDKGRWWRSPRLVDRDRFHGGDPGASMSEEQTWGVFLYLFQTKDRDAFQNWVNWIAQTRGCLLSIKGSCWLGGLPQWCTDAAQKGACYVLPFECVLFEALAQQMNPGSVIAVSHQIGCDVVMGATYGAATGLGAFLPLLSAGMPILLASLPALLAHDGSLADKIKALANAPHPDFPLDFFKTAFKLQNPQSLGALINSGKLPSPIPVQNFCVQDFVHDNNIVLAVKIAFPVNQGCIIPPQLFKAAQQVTAPSLGFTAGYPVQAQVFAQALATSPSHYYAIHKIAVQIYILQKLGMDNDILRKAAGKIRNLQESKGNPFLIYLTDGPTKAVADEIENKCETAPPPESRTQWSWERSANDHPLPWLNRSYGDCIFAAKLLTGEHPALAPALQGMRTAQSEAVKTTFSKPCEGLSFAAPTAAGQPPAGQDDSVDYLIQTHGPASSNYPQNLWLKESVFVAPCTGKYSIQVHAASNSPGATLDAVSTFEYGKPIVSLQFSPINPVTAKAIYRLNQYEGVAKEFRRGFSHHSINSARLAIDWCAIQDETKECNYGRGSRKRVKNSNNSH
jgi:hypothetical protein